MFLFESLIFFKFGNQMEILMRNISFSRVYYNNSIETNWANSKRLGWYSNARYFPKDKRKWRPSTGEYRNFKPDYTGRGCSINSWPTRSKPTNRDKITGELNSFSRASVVLRGRNSISVASRYCKLRSINIVILILFSGLGPLLDCL